MRSAAKCGEFSGQSLRPLPDCLAGFRAAVRPEGRTLVAAFGPRQHVHRGGFQIETSAKFCRSNEQGLGPGEVDNLLQAFFTAELQDQVAGFPGGHQAFQIYQR